MRTRKFPQIQISPDQCVPWDDYIPDKLCGDNWDCGISVKIAKEVVALLAKRGAVQLEQIACVLNVVCAEVYHKVALMPPDETDLGKDVETREHQSRTRV